MSFACSQKMSQQARTKVHGHRHAAFRIHGEQRTKSESLPKPATTSSTLPVAQGWLKAAKLFHYDYDILIKASPPVPCAAGAGDALPAAGPLWNLRSFAQRSRRAAARQLPGRSHSLVLGWHMPASDNVRHQQHFTLHFPPNLAALHCTFSP